MNNLNEYGGKFLFAHLRHYAEGLISFEQVKGYTSHCFNDYDNRPIHIKRAGVESDAVRFNNLFPDDYTGA